MTRICCPPFSSHISDSMFSFVRTGIRRSSLFSTFRFDELDLHAGLKRTLANQNIEKMTEIQAKSFVPISRSLDTILCSETGSGKTLAYLVPLFNRIMLKQEMDAANPSRSWRDVLGRARSPVVVICASVELCKQTLQVASDLDCHNKISKQFLRDTDKLENVVVSPRIRWGAVDLVVSTPSKFAQDMASFKENGLKPSTIVFDEADLLFHGATQAHVLDIIGYLRPRVRARMGKMTDSEATLTQFVFASATVPEMGPFSIGSMITQRFPTAELIRCGNFHGIPTTVKTEWIEESKGDWEERCFMLTNLLQQLTSKFQRIIVFVNSSRNCELLFKFLAEKNWPVLKYSKSSIDDKSVFTDSNSAHILVATDLAARGIDWTDVDVVVNFQMSRDVVTWIHRAGRCGRIGKPGKVVTFYKETEGDIVKSIQSRLGGSATSTTDLSPLFSRKRSLRRKIRVS